MGGSTQARSWSVAATICLFASCLAPKLHGALANDNFAERLEITGTNAIVYGSLSNATIESAEPIIPGVSSGQTAWWTWTAPAKGLVHLGVEATNFNPLVTVFSGSSLTNLLLVASNNYQICYSDGVCGCHWRMRGAMAFHVAAGEQYQIAADVPVLTDASLGWQWQLVTITNADGSLRQIGTLIRAPTFTTNVAPGGELGLHIEFTPAPANDDFRHRRTLSGQYVHTPASNIGATKEPGEPEFPGNPGGSSVWYSWTAPVSGRVTLSTNAVPRYNPPTWWEGGVVTTIITGPSCGDAIESNPPPVFYALLAAYIGGAVNALSPVQSDSLDLPSGGHVTQFDAQKGQTYHICFDGNQGTSGDVDLYLALTPPAANDNFANRIVVSGVAVRARGYNVAATHQAGEPVLPGSQGKGVWWSWRAPVTGMVWIDLSGSDAAYPVGVFTGQTRSGLSLLRCGSGSVSFQAVRGQTYQILVADAAGATGNIDLALNGPVVQETLLASQHSPRADSAVLVFRAAAGDKVLLQRSYDGQHWANAGVAFPRTLSVSFLAAPAPKPNGPYYRAIIDDYLGP